MAAGEYTIEYVSPAVVRCGNHECGLDYKDAHGGIYFKAVETNHESGGVVIFPMADEWPWTDTLRRDQRAVVRERLCAYLRSRAESPWTPQALSDGSLTPREAEFVAEHYARLAVIKERAGSFKPDGLKQGFPLSLKTRLILGVVIRLAAIPLIIYMLYVLILIVGGYS